MKLRTKLRYAVTASVNAAALIGALILTAVGSSMAKSQSFNYAAERWSNGESESYSQISCFFADDSDFTTDSVMSVRVQLINALQNVAVSQEEGKLLCPDAYSAPIGQASVRCDISGYSEAELTVVGGEFFMFRNFRLLDGAFFNDNDIMQDGVVIDRELAWSLYGSENISGMNIYINGVKLYISGVIDSPATDAELKCCGELPKAYISYETAGRLSSEPVAEGETAKFRRINCYECIMPDPVENYAYTSVKDIFSEAYKGKVSIVNNSDRFNPSDRAKAAKSLQYCTVRDDGICLPYWENASRIVEFRLSVIYCVRRVLLAIPLFTIIWLVIYAIRAFRRKGGFIGAARRLAEALRKKKAS